jgi:hypothetical protein
MTIKVNQTTNSFSVKIKSTPKYKVSVSAEAGSVAGNLADLDDVQLSGLNDKYLLMYDASSGKWKDVNPDAVLSAATTEPIQPGLPADFQDQLDIDLDDRIDLDAGNF